MTIRKLFFASLLLACLAIPATAFAAETSDDLEAFRVQLLTYVEDLQRLPPALRASLAAEGQPPLADAAERIRGLSPQELLRLRRSLEKVPYWQSLPRALAASASAIPGPVELAATLDAAAAGVQPEALRAQMIGFLGTLKAVPPQVVGADYHARIERVERIVQGLAPDQLLVLRKAMEERQPVWEKKLEGKAAGGPRNVTEAHDSTCGSGFPGGVLCEIDHIIDHLEAIPSAVSQFAQDAVNQITNGLTSLFSTLGGQFSWLTDPDPQDLLNLIGLDVNDPNWWQGVAQSVPELRPPCPPAGTQIPGIGEIGDLKATYVCKRGLEWVAHGINDLAPDDIWGVKVKLITSAVYYPINYLCMCYEEASTLAAEAAADRHDALQTERLNVKVSTRATQTNVDGARAQTSDLDGDVAAVERKLDILESKVDHFQSEQGETSAFLLQFQDLALRLRIEADLYREGNDRVSLFQLPKSVGGFLDTARAIVADTIHKRQSAGGDLRHALAELDQGDRDQANGAYKDAYTHYRKAYKAAAGSL